MNGGSTNYKRREAYAKLEALGFIYLKTFLSVQCQIDKFSLTVIIYSTATDKVAIET